MGRKFIFKYSTIYDKNWALALKKEYDREKNKEKAEEFINNFSEIWDPKENQILEGIAFYSRLKWKSENVKIYFVSNLIVSGFSDPLTVRMSQDYNMIAKTLTHEAVHEILLQNDKDLKKVYEELDLKFPKENIKTKVHLIVNAVTEKVFSKVFGEQESERIKNIEKQYKGLKRAYELLEDIEIKDDVIKSILSI